jgi:hypothetical protein
MSIASVKAAMLAAWSSLNAFEVVASPTVETAATLRDRLAEGIATAVSPDAWQSFTFQNSWVDGSSLGNAPAAYRKLPDGNVQFRGAIKNGSTTSGVVIANLPSGYRPVGKYVACIVSQGQIIILDVATNGDVRLYASPSAITNTEVILDTILFPTT